MICTFYKQNILSFDVEQKMAEGVENTDGCDCSSHYS